MSGRPLIDPSSRDGRVRRALVILGLLALILMLLFAPRGRDIELGAARPSSSAAGAEAEGPVRTPRSPPPARARGEKDGP